MPDDRCSSLPRSFSFGEICNSHEYVCLNPGFLSSNAPYALLDELLSQKQLDTTCNTSRTRQKTTISMVHCLVLWSPQLFLGIIFYFGQHWVRFVDMAHINIQACTRIIPLQYCYPTHRLMGHLCCEEAWVLALWDNRPLCEFGLAAEPRLAGLPAALLSPDASADPRLTPSAAEPRLTDVRRGPLASGAASFVVEASSSFIRRNTITERD